MILRLFLFVSFCVLLASNTFAQLASQTALVGTVTDSSGGVIPGAMVVAVNLGTQDTYEATTNAQGNYNIQFVRIGRYDLTVTLAGFQTFKATGIEVASNQVVRTDAALRVGGVTESVTVEAGLVLVTENATISERISERAVVELPVSGRNVWSLAGTTPGVLGGTNSFIGAGQRNITNGLSLDGINTAANIQTQTTMRPIADAVAEVEVKTGSTSAEYGSYLGVLINVVTKSGTNNPHGSLFEFFRDETLQTRGFFESPNNPKRPQRFDQFGFELDGPVLLPKLYDGRNKTFFMAAYEGVRQTTQATSLNAVPTELMRQGDFSEFSGVIRNPFTGQPFANNRIPQEMLSAQALRLLQYYPLPNQPGIGNNLLGEFPTLSNTNQVLTRVDQNLGNKVRLYGRYNWQADSAENGNVIPTSANFTVFNNKNTLFAYTHTLGSNLVNDFRIGYHVFHLSTLNYFAQNGLISAGKDLGIPGFDGGVANGDPGLPTVNITGLAPLGSGDTNRFQDDTTFQVSNVLAYTHGAHNIRTGFDLRRLATGTASVNDARGFFTFNAQMTGYAPADFLLGLPQRVLTSVKRIQGYVVTWRNGFFIDDSWQASRKLTLSLGLRYDQNVVPYTTIGNVSILNQEGTKLIPEVKPTPGFSFHAPNNLNFAPRLGLAYRATEKTVLRAGFGIYYNPNQLNTFTFLTNNPPFSLVYLFTQTASNPTLSLAADPTSQAGPAPLPNIITVNWDLPPAQKRQWSAGIQREIWDRGVMEVQYVGSHTLNLDRSFFNNTPQPGPGALQPRRPNQLFADIRTIINDTIANYEAVSLIYRQRISRGVQVNANYTWSRTYDMLDNSNTVAGRGMDPYNVEADYGPAIWDVPHRFVASYIYDVPFLKGSPQPILRYVFGGWQVGGITTIESGRPFSVFAQGDVANTGRTDQRANQTGPAEANCGRDQLTNCIPASAFAVPQFAYGNSGRNALRGPGQIVTDLSLLKNIPLGGQAHIQFRAEVFNLFNRANFNNPNSVLGTATFGSITSAKSMRQVQLGAKLLF